jgi:hypothetical protein
MATVSDPSDEPLPYKELYPIYLQAYTFLSIMEHGTMACENECMQVSCPSISSPLILNSVNRLV